MAHGTNWLLYYTLASRWRRLQARVAAALPKRHSLSKHDTISEKISEHLVRAEFDTAFELYSREQAGGYKASSSQLFELHAGCGRRAAALDSFRQTSLSRDLRAALGTTHLSTLKEILALPAHATLLVLVSNGPGDEIRFAAYYKLLLKLSSAKIVFTCDPRLQSVLQRSFPTANFIAVDRLHRLWSEDNAKRLKSARLLPKFSLYRALDDNMWTRRNDYTATVLHQDILGDLERARIATDVGPYFAVEPQRRARARVLLASHRNQATQLIGLCWRSIFVNKTRNVHYLALEELRTLLDTAQCKFVLLQAKLDPSERQWLQQNFSEKIVFVDALDVLNDFEGLAALMSELDAVVAPATYIAEAAGAVGVRTILLSNSSMNAYRHDTDMVDILYPNMVHCEPEQFSETSRHAVFKVLVLLQSPLPKLTKTGIPRL